MNFNIITLGCKVNQYESQAMREDMLKNGFTQADAGEKSDITIINSCTVTSVSDAKNRKIINRVKRENPEAIIVLTGCMPQAFPADTENFANCDVVLGNAKRADLVPSIRSFLGNREKLVSISSHAPIGEQYEKLSVASFGEHTRAFIKIEDGCNRFCSYCIIPFARGRVRSKSLDCLKTELEHVAANGYKEVVMVGINLSAYGLGESFDLADAVECACSVEEIQRVRLGSIEPERMDKAMISRLAAQPKFCPQFHLSLQSGCDNTLKAMNRRYSTKEYAEIVTNLRSVFDNASVTTDIMVGFAGESEEDFMSSVRFVQSIGFAKAHIFPYSRREGTVAAKSPDQVSPREKTRRAKFMTDVCNNSRKEFLNSQVGLTEAVLIERLRHGYLEGYTENYTPVHINSTDSSLCGKIADVSITKACGEFCEGELRL